MAGEKGLEHKSPPPAPSTEAQALEESRAINMGNLLKENNLELVASTLLEDAFRDTDIFRKDSVDRFLEFVIFKVQTGAHEILHQAYPARRMADRQLEAKVVELINRHLYPEIVLKLLKFFMRNIHDADSNLYLANLITSEDIIRGIYDTYVLFKNDIFESDPDKRAINVKRIQQVSPRAENRSASPLDAACRLKYILEFIALKQPVEHIYTKEDLVLAPKPA
jgi:hypothetical protein